MPNLRAKRSSVVAPADATRVQRVRRQQPQDRVEVERRDEHPHRSNWNEFWHGMAQEITNAGLAPAIVVNKSADKLRSLATRKPNKHSLEHPLREAKEKMEEHLHPFGTSGRVGKLSGMALGELPYYVEGGKAVEVGLNNITRSPLARGLLRAIEESENTYGATKELKAIRSSVMRGLGQAVTGAPVAFALGASQAEEGENILPKASLSAAAWTAAGFVFEPVMEVGARAVAAETAHKPIIKSALHMAGQRLSMFHPEDVMQAGKFLTQRFDDYMKYDISDRMASSQAKLRELTGW